MLYPKLKTIDPPKDKYVNGVYTAAVNKPEGVRYYEGISSDQSMAQKKALSKSRINPADSVANPNIIRKILLNKNQ